jgi:hypothetical protein
MKTHKNQNSLSLPGSCRPITTLPLFLFLLFLGVSVSGLAAEREYLDQRILTLTGKFAAMQAKTDKRTGAITAGQPAQKEGPREKISLLVTL